MRDNLQAAWRQIYGANRCYSAKSLELTELSKYPLITKRLIAVNKAFAWAQFSSQLIDLLLIDEAKHLINKAY